jgi:hypothetical protein
VQQYSATRRCASFSYIQGADIRCARHSGPPLSCQVRGDSDFAQRGEINDAVAEFAHQSFFLLEAINFMRVVGSIRIVAATARNLFSQRL